jgi:hypothetical protein
MEEKPKKAPRKSKKQEASNKPSAEMVNFYELDAVKCYQHKYINPHFDIHNITIPFRMIIVAMTLTLVNLLKMMQDTFNKIVLITQNRKEPLYEYLENAYDKSVFEIHEGLDWFNKLNIDKEFGDEEQQTLIIFDDMVKEKKQTQVEQLWLRARKVGGGISCCYLTQSYFDTLKFLRTNTNYIILKKSNGVSDIKAILKDYTLSADKEQLLNMYNACVNNDDVCSFFMIDLQAKKEKAYRYQFNTFLDPNKFT